MTVINIKIPHYLYDHGIMASPSVSLHFQSLKVSEDQNCLYFLGIPGAQEKDQHVRAQKTTA